MNWDRTWAIVHKEWLDMRKNRMVLIMMAVLPILLVGMILGTTFFMERAPDPNLNNGNAAGLPVPPELQALDSQTAMIILVNDQYMFYLLLIPMMLPVYVASYSIIGEKQMRSLEPLLATPITTTELLVGKILAAVSPAVLLAWLSFACTAAGMTLVASPVVFRYLTRPVWTLAMAVHSPLFALLSTSCGVIASSRLNDPRAAQQVTGLFVVPLIIVSLAVLMGRVYLDLSLLLWATLVVISVNAATLWVAVRIFQRETILTRWR